MSRWSVAVVNEDGERLAVLPDARQALDWAADEGFTDVREVDVGPRGFSLLGRQQNPVGQKGPYAAWRGLGFLRIRWSDVEQLSVDDAYRRILALRMPIRTRDGRLSNRTRPLWPRTFIKAGERLKIKRYQTSTGFVNALMGDNDKMAKKHPAHPSRVAGLSLLPAGLAAQGLLGRVNRVQRSTNLCVGSNAECRNSCLVYSGRNDADPFNARIKEARTAALMADPPAFGRLLYERCLRWSRAQRTQMTSFLRLNVFSDVPWELVFPELFTQLPRANFYDYTKVPWRPELAADVQHQEGYEAFPFPANYDLTFSVSGTNDQDAYDELRNGRRVAVVFETEKHVTPQWWDAPFWPTELPVLDGDESDVRPLDPSAEALNRARDEIGAWTLDMTDVQRKRHQARVTKRAFKYTFGRRRGRMHIADLRSSGPVIVGLAYKPPLKAVQRVEAERAQAKGRKASARRAFLVPVTPKGQAILAPGCPKTVTFVAPVVPGDQPGVMELDDDEAKILAAAKPTRRRRSPKLKVKE